MSMRVLAFDTTTELCSVAVMIDQYIYQRSIFMPRCHTQYILPMIDQILSSVGITIKLLDFIVFSEGPGSFVGVRVGISVAQGLSLGTNLPLVKVSSLKTLAQGVWRVFKFKHIITVINSSVKELYYANYIYNSEGDLLVDGNIVSINELDMMKLIKKLKNDWVLIGTGWKKYQMFFNDSISETKIFFKKTFFPEAQDMLLLGMKDWKKNFILTADQIQPIKF